MRKLYFLILVILGIIALYAGKMAARPYAGDEAILMFIAIVVAFFTMLAVLLLSNGGTRLRDIYPVRMARLWSQAKEAELRKRAND